MRALLVAASLLLLVPSAAAIEPDLCSGANAVALCAAESDRPCEGGYTRLFARASTVSVTLFGYETCDDERLYVAARLSLAGSHAIDWREQGGACTLTAYGPAGANTVACPAGTPPPNLGWGELLP